MRICVGTRIAPGSGPVLGGGHVARRAHRFDDGDAQVVEQAAQAGAQRSGPARLPGIADRLPSTNGAA
jgi:hypothetical protein